MKGYDAQFICAVYKEIKSGIEFQPTFHARTWFFSLSPWNSCPFFLFMLSQGASLSLARFPLVSNGFYFFYSLVIWPKKEMEINLSSSSSSLLPGVIYRYINTPFIHSLVHQRHSLKMRLIICVRVCCCPGIHSRDLYSPQQHTAACLFIFRL